MPQLTKIDNNKNLPYQAWLHWHINNQCNLNCDYCTLDRINRNVTIDTNRLLEILNKTNKIFHISFAGGGEPFLVTNLIPACQELTKHHYISLVTNLTSQKVQEFAKTINPKRVISIIASVHFEELEKNNLLEMFCQNFLLLKNLKFNIEAQEVAHPRYIKQVDDLKKKFNKHGINLKFRTFIGKYKKKNYPRDYTQNELEIFNLESWEVDKHYQYDKICNAGYNCAYIDLDGNILHCFDVKKKIGHIYSAINFYDHLKKCPSKFCTCSMNTYDPALFSLAKLEQKDNAKNFNFIQKQLFKLKR